MAAARVVAHLESFRPNTVDVAAVYVAISRTREHASIYTDSSAALTTALGICTSKQIAGLDEALTPAGSAPDSGRSQL